MRWRPDVDKSREDVFFCESMIFCDSFVTSDELYMYILILLPALHLN